MALQSGGPHPRQHLLKREVEIEQAAAQPSSPLGSAARGRLSGPRCADRREPSASVVVPRRGSAASVHQLSPAADMSWHTPLAELGREPRYAVFASLARERPDFVAPDALFFSRRVQIANLAAADRIAAAYSNRDFVTAGS
jgi:hypothetical protein